MFKMRYELRRVKNDRFPAKYRKFEERYDGNDPTRIVLSILIQK